MCVLICTSIVIVNILYVAGGRKLWLITTVFVGDINIEFFLFFLFLSRSLTTKIINFLNVQQRIVIVEPEKRKMRYYFSYVGIKLLPCRVPGFAYPPIYVCARLFECVKKD